MRHANIEIIPEGGARVWADFPNIPAALKAIQLLLTINPDAFAPVPQCAATIAYQEGVLTDGAGVMPHNVAEALMRDLAEDDEVVFPRACPAGGCGED